MSAKPPAQTKTIIVTTDLDFENLCLCLGTLARKLSKDGARKEAKKVKQLHHRILAGYSLLSVKP